MNPNDARDEREDLDALAGEYVLGCLALEDRQDVERRLAREPALQAAVDAWERRLLPLTSLAPAVEPSAELWTRIERQLDGLTPTAQAAPGHRDRRPAKGGPAGWSAWWNHLALWRGLAAAGVAAALLFGLRPGLLGHGGAPQYVVVLVAPGGQAPGWVVQVKGPGQAELAAIERIAAPSGRALELWTKADDWAAPVSLGLVRPGEPIRLQLGSLPATQPNQLFEITLEPPTGSPTGLPTGPIQSIGRAVQLRI